MNWLKYSMALLLLLLAGVGLLLYKGDLPIAYVDAKYTNEQSQFLTMSNGARVHYRDEGDKTKTAIVLVHGSNASLHTWEPWVAILGNDYRVISMDLPAHGLTGATPDGDYSSQAQINTVDAVVSHLQLDSFVLGGNSMGGGVTWRYTLSHPDKVSAMMLIDSGGLPQFGRKSEPVSEEPGEAETREPPVFFKLMANPWFRVMARYLDPYWLTKQGLVSAYNNSPIVTDELIDRYYELALREGSREATISRFSGYRNSANKPVDAKRLSLPTLIMWGRQDALIPVSVAHQFAGVLEKHTLVIYDDVGHIPMEEIPGRSANDVLAFLDSTVTSNSDTEPLDP